MFRLQLVLGLLTLKLYIIQATYNENPICFRLQDETCPNANISIWLYNQDEPFGQKVNLTAFEHDFDIATPLKVLLHDLGGNRNTTPNNEVRSQLMSFRYLNIISVDYGKLVPRTCYAMAAHNVRYVGRCVGQFLAKLMNNQLLLPQNLHIIGFGLGAHLANYVANHLKSLHLRVGHITGLDPGKPLFLTANDKERLDPSDADFVDVIHTDVFLLGFLHPLGHVDFYPNMGVAQPNCGPQSQIQSHLCYHERAAVYYAESIFSTKNFWSFSCANLFAFMNGSCQPLNDYEVLGYHVSPFARGSYFLATNSERPFARGKNFKNLDRSLKGKTYLGDFFANKVGSRVKSLFKKKLKNNK